MAIRKSFPLTKNFLCAQLIFLCMLSLCYLLDSAQRFGIDAISTLGTRQATIIPYSLGYLTVAASLFYIALKLSKYDQTLRKFSLAIKILCICVLGILCTPFTLSFTVLIVHGLFLLVLIFTELYLAFLIVKKHSNDTYIKLLLILQLLGISLLVTSLSEVGITSVLGLGELISVIAFCLILTRKLYFLEKYAE